MQSTDFYNSYIVGALFKCAAPLVTAAALVLSPFNGLMALGFIPFAAILYVFGCFAKAQALGHPDSALQRSIFIAELRQPFKIFTHTAA